MVAFFISIKFSYEVHVIKRFFKNWERGRQLVVGLRVRTRNSYPRHCVFLNMAGSHYGHYVPFGLLLLIELAYWAKRGNQRKLNTSKYIFDVRPPSEVVRKSANLVQDEGCRSPPDKQLRCYTSNDIAPLRGTVGHHRAYMIGRVRYTLYIVKFK